LDRRLNVLLRRTTKAKHKAPPIVELKHAGGVGDQASFLAIEAAIVIQPCIIQTIASPVVGFSKGARNLLILGRRW
jgi:hypothetical protein